MKKLIILLLTAYASLFTIHIISQPCLPDGITFNTQAQIDSFQINYPNCIEIEGDVSIQGYFWEGSDITNLDGLSSLTSIGGNLSIGSVWGTNPVLASLTGLDNLNSIGGDLFIVWYNLLNNLTGLESLNYIGGELHIRGTRLVDLSGLENLTQLQRITIHSNELLNNLSGLENLTQLQKITIRSNDLLNNLSGIENINPATINELSIYNNSSLSSCDIECICNYLMAPNGSVDIYNNAIGCNSPYEVAIACGFTISCLPYGNYNLLSQSDIDNFPILYPECNQLQGDIRIHGYDISSLSALNLLTSIGGSMTIGSEKLSNLNGLENLTSIGGNVSISGKKLTTMSGLDNLTSIGGDCEIKGNHSLENFSGLDNLTSIGGDFYFAYHDALTSLTGLNNLSTIGGVLRIHYNKYLLSLTGLENLTSIDGELRVDENDALTSLVGLENIDHGSITYIKITNNDLLTSCAIANICDYLADPQGSININNNATGCNSQQEVKEACGLGFEDVQLIDNISIYPNPFSNTVTIEFELKQPKIVTITIYNHLGIQIEMIEKKQSQGKQQMVWSAEGLPAGVYFFVLKTSYGIQTIKMIKLK